MTKSLEQIQEENRKFILEAIHGCSYEEALKKELGFNCEVIARVYHHPQRHIIDNLICYFDGDYLRFKELVGDISTKDLTETGLKNLEDYESTRYRIIQIIGKPLTLSRVLLALKSKENLFNPKRYEICLGTTKLFYYDYSKNIELVLDLTKETLEEQTEETQRDVNKLITNKN
jgi:hypothetical protein